ncbi:hypothetical protein [Sphingorhabdus sp.]|uniref:hypothetical protein n=1 Tax=Sphingorhabdus sp. TaxID=1902408 RepID=UPI00333FEAF7
MKITMKAALLAATLTVLSAMPAQAQQVVTASVNARAGLAPLTSVVCDDVNFGVWRVPVRATGGTSIVTLTVSANTAAGVTTAAVTGNTSNVAVAGGYIAPTAATCVVSGATNISTTLPTAISNNIGLSFGSSTHESLRAPPTLATLSANLSLAGTGVVVDSLGAGAFRVVGVLTIPQAINAVNYGGYRTSNAATVSVTDAL